MWQPILDNILGGFAVFVSGGVLGYVIAKLGGISNAIKDVENLKIQNPITVAVTPTPVVPAPVATVTN